MRQPLFLEKKSALKLAKRSVTEGVYCRLLEEVLRQDKTKFPSVYVCASNPCSPPQKFVFIRKMK